MAYNALFDKREVPGEREREGDLTRPEKRKREAATTARHSVAAEVGGGAGTKLGCGCLAKKNGRQMGWEIEEGCERYLWGRTLGRHGTEDRSGSGLNGDGTVSDFATTRGRRSLTSGPGWSAAGKARGYGSGHAAGVKLGRRFAGPTAYGWR